jgi:hypothetical protein
MPFGVTIVFEEGERKTITGSWGQKSIPNLRLCRQTFAWLALSSF